jgi:hypothetical protein
MGRAAAFDPPPPRLRESRGQHRGQHRLRLGALPVMPVPRNHAVPAQPRGAEWARLDSNQGPTDYESAALTN